MISINDQIDNLVSFGNDESNSILERRLAQLCENIILGIVNPDYDIDPIEQIKLTAKIIKKGYV